MESSRKLLLPENCPDCCRRHAQYSTNRSGRSSLTCLECGDRHVTATIHRRTYSRRDPLNEARAEEAVNLYKSTALNAFREVEQVLATDEWLREQEKALRHAVEQTEASRKLAIYSYQLGIIEILTLLDSYRSTLNAQSAHLSVKRQLLTNRINLYLALGGGV